MDVISRLIDISEQRLYKYSPYPHVSVIAATVAMQFIRQPVKIQVISNRKFDNITKNILRHGPLLPNTVRGIVCGPSNCGKTNVVISMLESPNGMRFENVYVYSKSLQQPKYQYLEKLLSSVENVGYFPFSHNSDVIPPNEALPNSIFIFDDVACDKQDVIREYFSMGRHSKVDSLYLCQSYARIPKHLIRDNTNLLLLFKQDSMNLHHVYNDHVNTDMTFEQFNELCAECWQQNYGFVVIDKDSPMHRGRYRRGFNDYVIV